MHSAVDTLASSTCVSPASDRFDISTDGRPVEGIPGFWLKVLNSAHVRTLPPLAIDEPALRRLSDVRVTLLTDRDAPMVGAPFLLGCAHRSRPPRVLQGFRLAFHFDENDYFTNRVLTKTYHTSHVHEERGEKVPSPCPTFILRSSCKFIPTLRKPPSKFIPQHANSYASGMQIHTLLMQIHTTKVALKLRARMNLGAGSV